jgi:hypothetical protein
MRPIAEAATPRTSRPERPRPSLLRNVRTFLEFLQDSANGAAGARDRGRNVSRQSRTRLETRALDADDDQVLWQAAEYSRDLDRVRQLDAVR